MATPVRSLDDFFPTYLALLQAGLEGARLNVRINLGELSDRSYIEAVTGGATPVRVGGLYLPNGNPIGTEKFAYKLRWMARLHAHAQRLMTLEEPLVLMGDLNAGPGRVRRISGLRSLVAARTFPVDEPT